MPPCGAFDETNTTPEHSAVVTETPRVGIAPHYGSDEGKAPNRLALQLSFKNVRRVG